VHALACLALALAAAPAVEVPLGDRDVPVDVALELRTSAGPSSPPLAWLTRPDGTLEGEARTAEVAATVRFVPAEGGAAIVDLSLRWLAPASLERAALVHHDLHVRLTAGRERDDSAHGFDVLRVANDRSNAPR